MKSNLTVRLILVVLGLQLTCVTGYPAEHATTLAPDIRSIVGNATHWVASQWAQDEIALFEGMPVIHGTNKELILLRNFSFVC
jgi:hypothetical protein